MSRWRIFFFCLLLCGCRPQGQNLEEVPTRIFSTVAVATSILLQCDAPIIAIDEYGRLADPEGRLQVVGRGAAISLEQIMALGIDGAVVWSYQEELAETLRGHGIRVLQISPPRLGDIAEMIQTIGIWSGKEERAEHLAAEFRSSLESIQIEEEYPPVPVYFELYSANKGAGEASYIGDLLSLAGGRSILPETGPTGSEVIVTAMPEVIFYIEEFCSDNLATRAGIAATPAGRNGRIYPVPRRLVTEGIAPFEAIEYLRKRMR